jgi:hypothetical protein
LRKTKAKEELRRAKCDEYLAVGCKVIVAFIIIFGICRREGV